MRDDVRALFELQKVDQEVLELKKQVKLYQPQLRDLEDRKISKEKLIKNSEQAIIDLQAEYKKIEAEIHEKNDAINKSQSKQSQVKTNQEFQALNKEMDTLKKQISELEEKKIQNQNDQERAKKDIENAKQQLVDEKEELEEEKQRIFRRIDEKKVRYKLIMKERPGLESKVDPGLLRHYNKLSKKFECNVVVHVKSKACQGCFFSLLPQKLIEVHHEKQVSYCRNCGRIFADDVDFEKKD